MATIAELQARISTVGADQARRELSSVSDYGDRAERTFSRLKTVVGTAFAGLALGASVREFAEYQGALAQIEKTSGLTGQSLADIATNFRDLSIQSGLAREDLLSAAEAGGRFGISNQKELENFAETVVKLGEATNIQGEVGAQSFAQFLQLSGADIAQAEKFGSVIAAVGDANATTESQLLSVAQSLAQSTQGLGFQSEELLAYSGTLAAAAVESQVAGSTFAQTFALTDKAFREGSDAFANLADSAGLSVDQLRELQTSDPTAFMETFLSRMDDIRSTGGDVNGFLNEFGLGGLQTSRVLNVLSNNLDNMGSNFDVANTAFEEGTRLQEEFDRSAAGLGGTFRKIQAIGSDAFLSVGSALGPTVKVLLDALVPALQRGAEFLRGLGEIGAGAAERLSDALSGISELVSTAFASINFGEAISGATGFISDLSRAFSSVFDGFSFGSLFQGLDLSGIFEAISSIQNAFSDLFSGFGESEGGASVLTQVFQGLRIAIEAVAGIITASINNFSEFVGGLVSAVTGVVDFSSVFERLKGAFDTVVTALKPVIDAFRGLGGGEGGQFFETLQNVYNVLGQIIGSGIGLFFNTLINIIETVSSVFAELFDFVGDVYNIFKDGFQLSDITAVWDRVTEYFSNLGGILLGYAEQAVKDILGAFSGLVDGIFGAGTFGDFTSRLRAIFDAAWTAITSIFSLDGATDLGGDIINGITDGIGSLATWATETFGGFVGWIWDAIGPQALAERAGEILPKIAEGIGDLAQWAAGIFGGFVQAITGAIGFSELVKFGAGVLTSIEEGIGSVTDWVSGVFDGVASAISGVFGPLGDWLGLNGDAATQVQSHAEQVRGLQGDLDSLSQTERANLTLGIGQELADAHVAYDQLVANLDNQAFNFVGRDFSEGVSLAKQFQDGAISLDELSQRALAFANDQSLPEWKRRNAEALVAQAGLIEESKIGLDGLQATADSLASTRVELNVELPDTEALADVVSDLDTGSLDLGDPAGIEATADAVRKIVSETDKLNGLDLSSQVSQIQSIGGQAIVASEELGKIAEAARSSVAAAVGEFEGLTSRLFNAGQESVRQFSAGIIAGKAAAQSAALEVANAVMQPFPQSPAKIGPLKFLTKSGGEAMRQFGAGIEADKSATDAALKQAEKLSGILSKGVNATIDAALDFDKLIDGDFEGFFKGITSSISGTFKDLGSTILKDSLKPFADGLTNSLSGVLSNFGGSISQSLGGVFGGLSKSLGGLLGGGSGGGGLGGLLGGLGGANPLVGIGLSLAGPLIDKIGGAISSFFDKRRSFQDFNVQDGELVQGRKAFRGKTEAAKFGSSIVDQANGLLDQLGLDIAANFDAQLKSRKGKFTAVVNGVAKGFGANGAAAAEFIAQQALLSADLEDRDREALNAALGKGFNDAVNRILERIDFAADVDLRTLELTNSPAAGIQKLLDRQAKELEKAQDLGFNSDEFAAQANLFQLELNDFLSGLDAGELAGLSGLVDDQALATAQAALATEDFIQRSRDLAAELNNGAQGLLDYQNTLNNVADGPLTIAERFQNAEAEFNRISQLALAGNLDAINQLPEISETYRNLGRDMFASGQQYQDIFANVQDVVGAVAQQSFDQANALTAQADALSGADLTNAANAQAVLDAIGANNQALANGDVVPIENGSQIQQNNDLAALLPVFAQGTADANAELKAEISSLKEENRQTNEKLDLLIQALATVTGNQVAILNATTDQTETIEDVANDQKVRDDDHFQILGQIDVNTAL